MCRSSGACRKLWVFDFDDTLVKSDSRVFLTKADGSSVVLTPAQFAGCHLDPGDEFDFREFRVLINARAIPHTDALLREAYEEHGPDRIVVLSARSVPEPIEEYLAAVGLLGPTIVALAGADPQAKRAWLSGRLSVGDVDELIFLDDSNRNVAAVELLRGDHPSVAFDIRFIRA